MTDYRPTRAEIDLDGIRSNVTAFGELTGRGVERLAVVKANAYGHGDIAVARACLDAGATRLGVALVEEGVALREAGIDAPILVLVDPPLVAAKAIVEHGLTPGIYSKAAVDAVDEAARVASRTVPVHLCVDTGMHREGVSADDAVEFVAYADGLDGLVVEGLWSHFAVADAKDDPFTTRQIETFADVCERVKSAGYDIPVRHLANSAGTIAFPDAHLDLVRIGVSIYGLYPAPWMREMISLRPAMRIVSAVSVVRTVAPDEGISYGLTYKPSDQTTIANVPIGYGDGFARLLSNTGEVLIGGKRRRVAGVVTMDTLMIDCGSDPVEVGDEVVILGPQGDDEITADGIASKTGTINYEVVTSISQRVPRVYLP